MKLLEEKILKEGTVLDGNILKVASFLNQKLDVDFIGKMGSEIADIYSNDNVTKILTIETSGIAIAFAAAQKIGCPVVFAKKHRTTNINGDVYSASAFSFTHQLNYNIIVPTEYLDKNDRIVIVDDFLANGNALVGLIEIVNKSGATLVGCTCAIEKGFQHGGDKLRDKGIRIESLAIIEKMSPEGITFRCN